MSTFTLYTISNFGSQVLAQSEISGYSVNFLGNASGGVVSGLQPNNNVFELAANDVYNLFPETLNIYALWQGLTSPTGLVTVTTQMATDEFGFAGWTISEETWVNGASVSSTQIGLYSAPDQTFTVPINTPFELQLQLAFTSNGASPYGDFGAYVIASLADPPLPVPGPIAGEGLGGIILAAAMVLAWFARRRGPLSRLV